MVLSKRSNGIYYVFYNQLNGKRTCISTGTKLKVDALKFLSNFEKKLELKRANPIIDITLKKFQLEFLKHSESIHSYNHTKGIKFSFNMLIEYFGNISLNSLTKIKLQNYIDYRLKKVSVYPVNRDIINLSSAFNWGVSQNYLESNLMQGIKKIKAPEKLPTYFSKEDFNKFLFVIDNEDFKDLVILAINTGMRQMELLTLTRSQIDLSRQLIILDNRNHITKSKKIRSIPLNQSAIEVLQKRIHLEQLFPFGQQQTVKLFRKYRKKAKINPELTFHSLRHSFATWLIQGGVSIYHVSKLLGHSDLRVTEIYTHVQFSDLSNAVNIL